MSTEILCLIIFLIAVIAILLLYILALRKSLNLAKDWLHSLMNGTLISESIHTLAFCYHIDPNELLTILENLKGRNNGH